MSQLWCWSWWKSPFCLDMSSSRSRRRWAELGFTQGIWIIGIMGNGNKFWNDEMHWERIRERECGYRCQEERNLDCIAFCMYAKGCMYILSIWKLMPYIYIYWWFVQNLNDSFVLIQFFDFHASTNILSFIFRGFFRKISNPLKLLLFALFASKNAEISLFNFQIANNCSWSKNARNRSRNDLTAIW